MTGLAPLTMNNASADAADMLKTVNKQLGWTPNIFKLMANSPASLKFYMSANQTLAGGSLSAKQRELIAICIARYNRCRYCESAHTAIGKQTGLSDYDIQNALNGTSGDRQNHALIDFSRKILETQGDVSEQDINDVRDAGLSDEQMVEVVANVALNIFTNYFNKAFKTDNDFE